MNTSYFIFPTSKMPEILDVLVQRGISLEQLMVEIIDRLEHNPDWKNVVCQNADHILDALNSGGQA
jgi:hypothetical protein